MAASDPRINPSAPPLEMSMEFTSEPPPTYEEAVSQLELEGQGQAATTRGSQDIVISVQPDGATDSNAVPKDQPVHDEKCLIRVSWFTSVFCCFCCGIFSLVFAYKVKNEAAARKYQEARVSSAVSVACNIVAIVTGIIIISSFVLVYIC